MIAFNKSWLKKTNQNGVLFEKWVLFPNQFSCQCKWCSCKISFDKSGCQALARHSQSQKHIKCMQSAMDNNQLRLVPTPCSTGSAMISSPLPSCTITTTTSLSTISLFPETSNDISNELLWTMHCIEKNVSLASSDKDARILRHMFPEKFQHFSLGRTKMSYLLTEALGPHFRKMLLDDVRGFYSLMYDETTNKENKKELQIMIRRWSVKFGWVESSHLETFFIGHTRATDIIKFIKQALDNAGLSLNKLASISSDGPNVDKSIFRILNEEIKDLRGFGLLDTGNNDIICFISCNIFIIYNRYMQHSYIAQRFQKSHMYFWRVHWGTCDSIILLLQRQFI